MKKLIALMLIVFMCLGAFVACGGDDDETSSSDSASESVSQSESASPSESVSVPDGVEDDTSNDNEVEF